jgi:hypothetical protein
MKVPNIFLSCLIVSAISLCSCSRTALKVQASKADPSEFKNYKTYAWIAPGDTALNTRRDDKIYAGAIQDAADKELAKKGLKVDTQNPDVVFMFDTKIDEKVAYRAAPTSSNAAFGFGGYNYGYNGTGYYYGYGNPMSGLETTSKLVNEGTLTYFMYDRATRKLVWQGWAAKEISKKTNIGSTIKRATTFIFAKLPIDQR